MEIQKIIQVTFIALLKLLLIHDEVLRNHLESPAMQCITYISPRTQNEVIEVLGKHIILRYSVDEMKATKFYTIVAEEVTSRNTEHLAICARSVDSNNEKSYI